MITLSTIRIEETVDIELKKRATRVRKQQCQDAAYATKPTKAL